MSDYNDLFGDDEFPEGLSSSQRRSFIRSHVFDMIDFGINQTNALRIYRDHGLGIRSSDFARIYQTANSVIHNPYRISTLDSDSPIRWSNLGVAERRQEETFLFIGDVVFDDLESGEKLFKRYAIDLDVLPTAFDVQELIATEFRSRYGQMVSFVHEVELIGGYYQI